MLTHNLKLCALLRISLRLWARGGSYIRRASGTNITRSHNYILASDFLLTFELACDELLHSTELSSADSITCVCAWDEIYIREIAPQLNIQVQHLCFIEKDMAS